MGAAFLPSKVLLRASRLAERGSFNMAATVYQHVEYVEEQRLGFGAVMLQEIERDAPALIQGHNLAIYKRIRWQPFTGTSDMRELFCEEVSSPGPERHPGGISTSETAVPVELDLIEPFPALGEFLNC
jgi:hypothetical protein